MPSWQVLFSPISLQKTLATDFKIADTDRLLDELEIAARSEVSNSVFYDQLLASLRLLVRAESSAIVLYVKSSGWVMIGQSGATTIDLRDDLGTIAASETREEFLSGVKSDKSWIAVAIRAGRIEEGCLVLTFDGRVPPSGLTSLSAIVIAFAEVLAIRQVSRWQKLLEDRWTSIQCLMEELSVMTSIKQSSELIVNRLLSDFSAARVAIIDRPHIAGGKPKTLAISGAPVLDRRSRDLASLERVASLVILEGKPVFRQEALLLNDAGPNNRSVISEDGTFKNLLALSSQNEKGLQATTGSIVILEWEDRDTMLESIPAITHFMPPLCSAWRQQQRWLEVPRLARACSQFTPQLVRSFLVYRAIQLLALAVMAGFAWWLLSYPFPMAIEANAVLEPKERRAIFSNVDGFIEKLFVEDGQAVEQGQLLAKLRSPALNLQIEEAIGQIKSISEKRNGLRVAVNQVSSATPEALVAQTRISADILLLEAQEKQTKDKLVFLTKEQEKLEIVSPIKGVVVSRDLRSELETRPLRRGDILFNVADLEGEWQLSIHVADGDSGYLMKHYPGDQREAKFVFDSLPSEQFSTVVQNVSGTIENPMGASPFLLVVAGIEKEVANRAYMGANARVRFSCGVEPLWFVWCRPLVEALQKRAWLVPTPRSEG